MRTCTRLHGSWAARPLGTFPPAVWRSMAHQGTNPVSCRRCACGIVVMYIVEATIPSSGVVSLAAHGRSSCGGLVSEDSRRFRPRRSYSIAPFTALVAWCVVCREFFAKPPTPIDVCVCVCYSRLAEAQPLSQRRGVAGIGGIAIPREAERAMEQHAMINCHRSRRALRAERMYWYSCFFWFSMGTDFYGYIVSAPSVCVCVCDVDQGMVRIRRCPSPHSGEIVPIAANYGPTSRTIHRNEPDVGQSKWE